MTKNINLFGVKNPKSFCFESTRPTVGKSSYTLLLWININILFIQKNSRWYCMRDTVRNVKARLAENTRKNTNPLFKDSSRLPICSISFPEREFPLSDRFQGRKMYLLSGPIYCRTFNIILQAKNWCDLQQNFELFYLILITQQLFFYPVLSKTNFMTTGK